MNAESRAHRILEPLKHYDEYETARDLLEPWAAGVVDTFAPGEFCIGVYRNSKTGDEIFFVSNFALWIVTPEAHKRVQYDTIARVEILQSNIEKTQAARLRVDLESGERVDLEVNGGEGRFRDVFAFSRFLARVKDDMCRKRIE